LSAGITQEKYLSFKIFDYFYVMPTGARSIKSYNLIISTFFFFARVFITLIAIFSKPWCNITLVVEHI